MKLLARFRKAAALPFVLLLVALNVIVVVALLVYATTELQASRNSGQAEVARALAQSGIDIAAGLIAANSTNNGFVSYQRVTNVGGSWRLETKIGNVTNDPSTPWKTAVVTNPNDPRRPAVLHSGFLSGTDGVDLNFPVKDPDTNAPPAGFIAPRSNSTNWTNLSTNMFRMDWIYVYRSGSTNPVGRIAYWVDDESSKLNINYSGITNFYSTNNYTWGQGFSQFSIKHTAVPSIPVQQNMLGEKWPIQMEFGGIGGISSTNAFFIINSRGVAKTNNFNPYPSVLAARIGTINKPGGIAITDISQQASFGFSATVYSKEEERSYATGKKRFDLFNVYAGANVATSIADLQNAIVADNPRFSDKYDLPTFAAGLYSRIQPPASGNLPTTTYGTSKLYARGMPLVNEFSIKGTIANTNGTNTGDIVMDVGFIVLSKSSPNPTDSRFTWAPSIANAAGYKVEVSFSPNLIYGIPVGNQTNSASTSTWYSPTNNPGPTNSAFIGAIKMISATNSIATNTMAQAWSFPTNITVNVKYNGQSYQRFDIPVPTNAATTLSSNQTNVFHVVSQPSGENGYRGDPRFGVFKTYVDISTNSTSSILRPSLGTLNTNPVTTGASANWKVDEYAAAANTPDLVESSLFFGPDRGIPQYTGDKDQGFGGSVSGALVGVGWIGEVPITTRAAPFLAWSTPRLWGDGRAVVNGTSYPPDWLLLDSFHMAAYAGEPTNVPIAQQTFTSYGRVNLNAGKPFFQIARSSQTKSDTIIDSVIVKAQTIDYREYHNNGSPDFDPVPNITSRNIPFVGDPTSATNNRGFLLSRIQQMVSDRNSADNPYTTHFEFLADLAATNVQYNPSWWVAPDTNNPTHSIYAATNTTDRRIEGIVRSLVQKLTTHGNQFSIFSLGQALQVVNGKTNVVGESYMQAVYERAPHYNESTGAITNGAASGAPPMRQLYLRELRY